MLSISLRASPGTGWAPSPCSTRHPAMPKGRPRVVRAKNPTLIAELLPDLVHVGVIQRVLQNLLREKISIKNLNIILETIADFAPFTKNPDELSEFVRKAMGLYFIQEYESEPGVIKALTLEPRLEQTLAQRVKRTQFDSTLLMDPQTAQHVINELNLRLDEMQDASETPILVTTQELRLPFKRFFEPTFPRLAVLAYQEIPNKVQLQNAGIIPAPRGAEMPLPKPERREQASAV